MNLGYLLVFIVIPLIVQAQIPKTCFNCNSKEVPSCAGVPSYNNIIACDPKDKCGVVINGTDTIRGCSTDIGEGDLRAEPCEVSYCNNQIFPEDRIKCHQCKDCVTVSDKTLLACQHYSASDECYIEVINETNVLRGCLSDKPANLTGFAQTCKGTGCNNQIPFETLKCVHCKSEEDKDCIKIGDDSACKITTTKECSVNTLLERPKRASCFTNIKDGKVERGCTEKEPNLDPTEAFCSISDYCNNNCIKPIKCLQCPPSDPKCETPTSQLCKNDIYCSACASTDGNITRACGYQNQGTCTNCRNKDECNSQKFCYKCSSDTNPNCATWKDLSGIKLEICEGANEVCVAALTNNRVVERGCKLPTQCTGPNCKSCSDKDKCNIDPFPENIRRCIQCSGPNCENEQKSGDSTVCDVFDPNDSCYAYADKSGVAHRGCTSNTKDYQQCNETGNCWTCNTNGCNTPKLLKCYSCFSSITGNCGKLNEPSSIETTTCQNPNQVCATIVKGDEVERGCKLPDAVNCDVGDPFCKKCSDKDNCNSVPIKRNPLRCMQCSGKDGCDKEQEQANATLCDDNEANCYVYANSNGDVFRGCTNEPEFDNCQKESEGKCWTCTKDGCNKIKMLSCYSCSSGLNENCATAEDINSIQSQFCPNPFDHCVSRLVNETTVQRGCQPLEEFDPNCGLNSKSCKTCEGTDNCNVDPIPRKEFTCIECSGTKDCRNGISSDSKTCSTYESCYIYRNASGNVFRGCISAEEDLTKCTVDSKGHCWTCKENECNKARLQKCYTCESGISGDCATFKNANLIPSETCYKPEEVCAAVRTGDRVQRGCRLPELLHCNPGDPMCRSCRMEDNCNDGALDTYPAKCIKCSGTKECVNGTELQEASYCEKNVEGEPCYAYADKDGNIFRGCVSNKEEYDKCQNSTDGHCWKCSGDGCNNIDFSHCLSCKSPSDENCATLSDLNRISSKVCQIPNQHCISRIVDNTVERGCYSISELPSSCRFNSPNCKTCNNNDCNTELLPRKQIECVKCLGSDGCQNEQDPTKSTTCSNYESCYIFRNALGKTNRGCISEREDLATCKSAGNGFCWTCNSTTCNTPKVRSCYTCKSDVNGNCATWSDLNPIESQTCQNPDEICATVTTGKMVERKCERPENVHCELGDATCQKCETDNCNNNKVLPNSKRCYKCSGTDECRLEQPAVNEKACEPSGVDDACYIYTDKDGHVFRGCTSSIDEYENCKKAGNGTCWTCNSTTCNKPKVRSCYTCKSDVNGNCATGSGPNPIESQTCQNPDEICATVTTGKMVERKCERPENVHCELGDATCQKCETDNCNNNKVLPNSKRCYKCSGTDECRLEQPAVNEKACEPSGVDDACYIYTDKDGHVFRGCTSSIDEYENCKKAGNGTCWTCNSTTCNKPKVRSCYTCKSDVNGNCATGSGPNPIESQTCQNPDEICATVTTGKMVERKCERPENVHCELGDATCQKCETDNCNNNKVLPNSKRCYKCSGTDECRLEQPAVNEKACEPSGVDDACYIYTDKDGHVFRGCTSSIDEYENCKKAGNGTCWTCNSTTCNKPKVRSCYTCKSDVNGNCATGSGPNPIESQTCQNPDEICATVTTGKMVERKCERPENVHCELGDATCQKCETDNCNNNKVLPNSKRCYKCSGTDECRLEQPAVNEKACEPSGVDDACYIYTDKDGHVFRGCTSSIDEYENCKKAGNGTCWTCNSTTCNKPKVRSCYTCKSDVNGNCATGSGPNPIESQTCQNPDEICATVTTGKMVERKCERPENVHCELGDATCQKCETDNCNNNKVLPNSKRCYKCSGTDECRLEQPAVNEKSCEASGVDDACYVYRNEKGLVFRGCTSSRNEYENCKKAGNGTCWTCNSTTCNKPKVRSCYTCKSDVNGNCATGSGPNPIESQTCQNPDEICATVTTGKMVERKCERPENVHCELGDATCQKCETDNCNNNKVLPNSKRCYKCSGTDECRLEQPAVNEKACEPSGVDDACYIYTDKDGHVFRGCTSSIDEYENCKKAGNGTCWTCNSTTCNKPKVRSCYTCKSDVNGNCATGSGPNPIESQTCQNPDEICATVTTGKMVERKCERPENVHCELGDATCQKCETDNCNNNKVLPNSKRCYKCSGTDECRLEQPAVNEKACEPSGVDDACYIYTDKDGHVFRGCTSSIDEYENCKKAGNGTCWTCNSTTCNKPKVRSCYTCKSDVNGNCATGSGPNPIESQTCQNPDEICATVTTGKMVERKCERPENVHCELGDATCQKCETDNCNNNKVLPNSKRCYKCSGTDECRLEQPAVNEKSCEASGVDDACYVYRNEKGLVFRGCTSSRNEYENCKKAGNGTCWTCTADGCNKDKILECYSCTTADDKNCGIWNATSGIASKICKNPDEQCVSYVNEEQTIRECKVPDKSCPPTSANCQNCKEDKCNAGTIQKVELKCYKCSNTDDCQEEQNSANLDRCPTTDTNPSCWAYSDINGKMIRGCSGDKAGFKKCQDSSICRVCDSDGCNKFPYLLTQSLQCLKCSDSEACGWGQTNNTISPCTNKIAYYLPESCITRRSGNNFERGCTFDLGICQGNTEFCEMCNTTAGCNNGNIVTQSCVQCKSTTEPKCSGTAEGIGGKQCPAAFTTFNDRGCYTRVTDMKGIVERGCSQYLSAADLSACKADKDHKFCEYCDGQDCNNKKAPNAAPVSVGLTIGVIILSSLMSIVIF